MPANVLIVDLMFLLVVVAAAASRWSERADREARDSKRRPR